MAVVKPKKTVLAEDIVARLKRVLKGQGFHTDLGRKAGQYVDRRIRVLSQMQEGDFPAATVLMGAGAPSEAMQSGSYREDAKVGVLLYAKANDVTAEIERLEADAKKAVLSLPLIEGAHGRARHAETVPYYNELEMVDRAVVLVTFIAPFNWTPDEQ
jgi:hypothetical protein